MSGSEFVNRRSCGFSNRGREEFGDSVNRIALLYGHTVCAAGRRIRLALPCRNAGEPSQLFEWDAKGDREALKNLVRLAWDDDTITDPTVRPAATGANRGGPARRVADLHELGLTVPEIASRLQIQRDSVTRALARNEGRAA